MASNTDTDTESYISYPTEGTKSSHTSTSISLDTSTDSKDDNESYETNIVSIVKKPHPSSSYDKPSPHDCLTEISKSLRGGITFYPKDVNLDSAQDYKETVCQIEELGIKDAIVYISSCLLVTLNIDPENVKIPKDLVCDIFILSTEFQPLILSRANPDNNQKRKYIARLASYINGQLRTITKEQITCLVFEVGLKEKISRKMIVSEMPKKSRYSLSTSMTKGKYKAAVEGFFSLIISCKTDRFIKHQNQSEHPQVLSKEEFDVLTCALDGRKADGRFETTSDTLLLKTEIASRLSRKDKTLLELPQHHHRLLEEVFLTQEYPLLTVTQPTRLLSQKRKYRNVVTGNVVEMEKDHKEDAVYDAHSNLKSSMSGNESIQPDDDLQTDISMTHMKTTSTSLNNQLEVARDSCRLASSQEDPYMRSPLTPTISSGAGMLLITGDTINIINNDGVTNVRGTDVSYSSSERNTAKEAATKVNNTPIMSRTSEQSGKKHGLQDTNRPHNVREITASRSTEPTNPFKFQLSLKGSRILDNNNSMPLSSEGILRKLPEASDDFKDVGSVPSAISRTDIKGRRHVERISSEGSIRKQQIYTKHQVKPDHEETSLPDVIAVRKNIIHRGLDRSQSYPELPR